MTIFTALLLQMIPFYGLLLVGFVSSKYIGIKRDDIAKLLIYVLLPVVSFTGIIAAPLTARVLSIPLLSFLLCTGIALLILWAGGFIWNDGTKNMLAVGIANGNFGFIGLPLTLILLGQQYIALTVLFGLGAAIFIATVGMYIAARANFNFQDSLLKVAKMPIIYALILGIIVNVFHVPIQNSLMQVLNNMTGAYSILGLILVGIAIGELGKVKIDIPLIAFTTIMTYILWPLIAFALIALDTLYLHFYSPEIYKVLLLMSIVPVGASIVAISTELKVEPEKASFVVLFTTLLSLIYVPAFIAIFQGFFA